jgi:hypothetical protein
MLLTILIVMGIIALVPHVFMSLGEMLLGFLTALHKFPIPTVAMTAVVIFILITL